MSTNSSDDASPHPERRRQPKLDKEWLAGKLFQLIPAGYRASYELFHRQNGSCARCFEKHSTTLIPRSVGWLQYGTADTSNWDPDALCLEPEDRPADASDWGCAALFLQLGGNPHQRGEREYDMAIPIKWLVARRVLSKNDILELFFQAIERAKVPAADGGEGNDRETIEAESSQ